MASGADAESKSAAISLRLPEEQLKIIDTLPDLYGKNRSARLRFMITSWLAWHRPDLKNDDLDV